MRNGTFVVESAPRTKKTSNRIVRIKAKGGGRGFTKILPSEAHEAWFKAAMSQVPIIRAALVRQGFTLPIAGEVAVKATFYRDRNTGDLLGYEQALADFLQEPAYHNGKLRRNGCGVIKDDFQIVSWDGSRALKDRNSPRIEVEIMVLHEVAVTLDIPLEEAW